MVATASPRDGTFRARPRFRIRPHVRDDIARLNVSHRRLARLCQISSGYMTQVLNGDRYPGPRVRERIMAALPDVEFDALFEQVS